MESADNSGMVKENVSPRPPLALRWLAALVALTAAALLLAARFDAALPAALPPTTADRFSGEAAHLYLRNLTSIGPRVAGSYENEVWTVGTLVRLVRALAADAAPHNVVELDRHEAAGAFNLTFFDGMNNVYRDVQSVMARVRGAGGVRAHEPALLLNCHFDTVPDSPGASDDGAGCAVLLETLRALAASGEPLRRPVVFLFNGAEENIMQGAHAFVTAHRWARAVRVFLNLEACGAGGREVLFQAGPRDPWLIEAYASAVPYPFASSLAQELFESGALPGDTDFRIFRDFGKLSGLDFAWSANGYVYHTALDTWRRVPAAALQRTGDNVVALARRLLAAPELAAPPAARAPLVYFDVLGVLVLRAAPAAAAALALAAAALVLLNVHAHAAQARRQLFVRRAAWWRAVGGAALWLAGGGAAGVLLSAALAGLLALCDASLAFYSRDWLLAPLAALPAITVSWWAMLRWARGAAWAGARGWWRARAARDGAALLGAAALVASAALRLRSGYLPLAGTLLGALADRLGALAPEGARGDAARAWLWGASAALPALQSWYLLLALLSTLAPIAGRAGSPALPADALLLALTAAVAQWAAGWLLPFVLVTRRPQILMYISALVSCVTLLLVASGPLYAPYSAERPQRLFVFHARRTLHAPLFPAAGTPSTPSTPADRDNATHEDVFWVPELDANTARTVREMAGKAGLEMVPASDECARWVYCGAPYYLPVRALVPRGLTLRARAPPAVRLGARLRLQELGARVAELHIDLTGPNHVVLIISPTRGTRVSWLSAPPAGALEPLVALPWREQQRDTYFVSLHAARPDTPARWQLTLRLEREADGEAASGADGGAASGADGARWASLSLSGHALAAGRAAWSAAHRALAATAHAHAAVTGWGVHTHLYVV
ncbi:endoplasmic reticulum metallopeptidase 1 [Amyelois transitella]|uniref:endoplasmic reticulum metallopeptidase 1 n=1 Tax=Amyelois transitella TaxID=680683 RepID=UPI00298FEF40|nr:endoplasmic reticulum metallopeptidase 1 [Amyelois transitella]